MTPLATEQVYLVPESSLGRRVGPTLEFQLLRRHAKARGWPGDGEADRTSPATRPPRSGAL